MAWRSLKFAGQDRSMSVEVRLLYLACGCFMTAQQVVNHAWNSAIQILGLLAIITAMFVGRIRLRRIG